jgi:hypothetical protein
MEVTSTRVYTGLKPFSLLLCVGRGSVLLGLFYALLQAHNLLNDFNGVCSVETEMSINFVRCLTLSLFHEISQ